MNFPKKVDFLSKKTMNKRHPLALHQATESAKPVGPMINASLPGGLGSKDGNMEVQCSLIAFDIGVCHLVVACADTYKGGNN